MATSSFTSGIVNWILGGLDTQLSNMAAATSDLVSTTLMPAAAAGLSVSLILYCWAIMRGAVEMPIEDFIHKVFFITLVLAFASASGIYSVHIIPLIQTLPTDLAGTFASGASSQYGTIDTQVNDIYETGMTSASLIFEQAIVGNDGISDAIALILVALIILIAVTAMTLIGLLLVIVVKVALALLATVGPIFILALLWQPTKEMFSKWLGLVLNYILLMVLFSIVFGFFYYLFSDYMRIVMTTSGLPVFNAFSVAGGLLLFCAAAVIVLLQLPTIASNLSSGMALGFGSVAKSGKETLGLLKR